MKFIKFLILTLIICIVISCEEDSTPEKEPKLYEQEMSFTLNDSTYKLTRQEEGSPSFYWDGKNPDTVTLIHCVEFTHELDYLVVSFHQDFHIDNLESDNEYFIELRNKFGGQEFNVRNWNSNIYIPSENEALKFIDRETIKIHHWLERSGVSIFYARVEEDDVPPYNIEQEIYTSTGQNLNNLVINKIEKIRDSNFETTPGGFYPEAFNVLDFLYHIEGNFSAQLMHSETEEIMNIENGTFEAFFYNIEYAEQ